VKVGKHDTVETLPSWVIPVVAVCGALVLAAIIVAIVLAVKMCVD
jgi:hypothetical protein